MQHGDTKRPLPDITKIVEKQWLHALLLAALLAARCIALFNHMYVWVHYYTTEYPDMLRIYPEGGAPEQLATG